MKDGMGREIDYLRVSITDRCNLRCIYCMPETGVEPVAHSEILTFEELVRVCGSAASLGVRKLKLTGGEPLVRRGVTELVRDLRAIEGIEQVTMTTNGILLGAMARGLADSGLCAVNISLDTLDPMRFAAVTRGGELSKVLASIDAALEAGLRVKLNCVPARELGTGEITALSLLAKERPIDVRFIEMMPIGLGGAFTGVPAEELRRTLEAAFGPLVPCGDLRGNGPARYYSLEGFAGKIGFIGAVSECFCAECNRVRLTAEGFLKLCLHAEDGLDLRALLRGGVSDAELTEAMRAGILQKPARHHFEERRGNTKIMSQIGG